MGNFKTWASLSQLQRISDWLLLSICAQKHTHVRAHAHTLSKSLWKTCCVYCAQIPSLHFLLFFSTNFEEKILYILKSPFRESCSSRTILKTVKTAEEEQVTVECSDLFLWIKPSEERWSWNGGITHACSEAMETSESQDYCKVWELGGTLESI